MAAKTIRALMLPNKTSILISMIAQAVPYEAGVGIFNERSKMIGWIGIASSDETIRNTKIDMVLETVNTLINNPRQAAQPSWDFLSEESAT